VAVLAGAHKVERDMPNLTDAAYRYAEGRCIDALVQLLRQEGTAAIESLKAAILVIEDDRRRVKRNNHKETHK